MKLFNLLARTVLLFLLFLFTETFSQITFPSFDSKVLKYGLKNSAGEWVLKPEYKSIQSFYTYQGIRIDTVSIVQKDEFYKQSNIVVKSNFGLVNEKGKIVIPLKYKTLLCNKGFCAAGTYDNTTVILNLKNGKIAEIKGSPQKIRDSVVVVLNKDDGFFYFTKIDKINLAGPFTGVDFTGKKLYTTTFSAEKAFYNRDGSVYLRNDSIYDGKPELYSYDLFLIKNEKGVTFSDRKGKLYDTYYQNVNPWNMTYCNKMISHGDYTTCEDGGTIDLKKAVEYYGFDSSVLFITKGKDLDYDILSTFSVDDLNNDNFENYRIIQYKKPESKTKKYAVLDKDRVVLNSEFPILKFFVDTALTQDPVTKKYYIVKEDRTVEVNQKELEKLKSFGSVYFNVSFNSKNNIVKVYNDLENKLFIINEKGNISEIKGKDITNFYNGFAYLNDGNKMFLINEKLERLKEISNVNNAVFGSFKDFYADGILIYNAYKNVPGSRDKEFYGAVNDKGDKVISESENRIYKENPVFYISYSETEKDEEGNPKNFAVNKNGKKIDPKDKVNGIYFSYYPNYLVIHYDYVSYYYNYSGEYLGNNKDGLDWEADKLERPRF